MARKDIYRISFEEDQEVILKGSLAETYSTALQAIYGNKVVDQTGGEGFSQESQQMDAAIEGIIKRRVLGAEEKPKNPFLIVYGVSQVNLDKQTLIDISKDISDTARRANSRFAILIDYNTSRNNTCVQPAERFIDFGQTDAESKKIWAAMESLATALDIPICASVEEFQNLFK